MRDLYLGQTTENRKTIKMSIYWRDLAVGNEHYCCATTTAHIISSFILFSIPTNSTLDGMARKPDISFYKKLKGLVPIFPTTMNMKGVKNIWTLPGSNPGPLAQQGTLRSNSLWPQG